MQDSSGELVSQPRLLLQCRFLHAQERKRYPQLIEIAARVPSNSELTKEDFQGHLAELDKSLRSVPATAQVQPPFPVPASEASAAERAELRKISSMSAALAQASHACAYGRHKDAEPSNFMHV